MEGPAQTFNYYLAGYIVIFSGLFIYLASLIVRWNRLKKEKESLQPEE